MRKIYPSDITREQFETVRPQLEKIRKRTKPRSVDLYEVFCAVLYVLRTGCQWRALPGDFPKWQTCHSYFSKWKEVVENSSLLERILRKQVQKSRIEDGRDARTTFLIVDAQSVKNTDTAVEKGYDAGKKVSGIKRHISVDTQGLPHAVTVTTADVTDRNGAILLFSRDSYNLFAVKAALFDGGYTGEPFEQGVKNLLGEHVEVQIAKRNELHKFSVIPKRWIVERSFAWLEKFRRLWKNCERKLNTSLQFVNLAFITLLLQRS